RDVAGEVQRAIEHDRTRAAVERERDGGDGVGEGDTARGVDGDGVDVRADGAVDAHDAGRGEGDAGAEAGGGTGNRVGGDVGVGAVTEGQKNVVGKNDRAE